MFHQLFRNLEKEVVPLTISKKQIRFFVYERDNYHCVYCGEYVYLYKPKIGENAPANMATLDHILPESQGGKFEICNLVTCCYHCNNYLGDSYKTFEEKKEAIRKLIYSRSKRKKEVQIWEGKIDTIKRRRFRR